MTLIEERNRIYSEIKAELDGIQEEREKTGQEIEKTLEKVKEADDGDARENAGLDIAKDALAKLYQSVLKQQVAIGKFKDVEEYSLYKLLFPDDTPPEHCFEYNNIGKAVLYSTLRLKIHRGDGRVQDLVTILMPSGFGFKTTGCCSVDNPAVKLLVGSKAGDRINYTCITGEKVVYEVIEVY